MRCLFSVPTTLFSFFLSMELVGMQDCRIELAWLATLQRRRAGEWRDWRHMAPLLIETATNYQHIQQQTANVKEEQSKPQQ